MGKIIETTINRFSGGIENDPRDPRENTCRMVSGFDILTNPRKMTPYRDSEDGDSAAATSEKQNFCLGYWTPTSTWRIFSLGVKSGAATAEILMKDLTTGASTDLDDNGWATPANNQSASGAAGFDLFLYYKRTGKIYGSRSLQYIWEFTPDGSTAWADSKYDYGSAFAHISQGIVHSKDDIMYFGIDNKIIKNDNGSFSVALTLPTHFYITSICEYGNLLAIGCASLSGIGNSVVYLWDRDASLVTLQESINWGNGKLQVLDTIDGYLIGISLLGGITTTFKDRIIFRYYYSGEAKKFKEIELGTSSTLKIAKQKVGNRIYFLMKGTFNGVTREGVWSIGRSTPDSPFSLIHERTPNNDTALTNGVLKNFFIVDDFMFISYVDNAVFYLSKTNDQASYTTTSIYETKIMGESYLKNQLKSVGVMFEKLSAGQEVKLKCRIDGATSWTEIFDETTDNLLFREAINFSDGTNLPEFREIEFQITSLGGAVITGFWAQAEEVDKGLVSRILKVISGWIG